MTVDQKPSDSAGDGSGPRVQMKRLNVGCGRTPTEGWRNYDNSPAIRMAKWPALETAGRILGLLSTRNTDFVEFAKHSDILWADVTRHIPEANGSVDVVYTSHMVEHLDREQALGFFAETRRVLRSGGILRIAVPDVRFHVLNYVQSGDADALVTSLMLTRPRASTAREKLRYLWVGDRQHQWMYDGPSLCRLLEVAGFADPRVMESGTTRIPDPGALNLRERSPESVFVEALNP